MVDVVADLEPQEDASASSEPEVRYANDKSINTAPDATPQPVEVETETKADVEEPESEADSSPAVEENDDETIDAGTEEVVTSVKDRIAELTGKWRESERAFAAMEQENAELRKQVQASDVPKEPLKTLADFDYNEGEYQAYQNAEITKRAAEAAKSAVEEQQREAEQARRSAEFQDSEKEFAKKVKDYFDVAHDRSVPINNETAQYIRAQKAPELSYYLGKNPDVARRIAALPPVFAGAELAKISSKLAAEKAKAKAPAVTKAPPPVPKIKSGDEGLGKNPSQMSDAEFRKWREKQIASR
jgi:hypothetical protein